MKKLIVGIIIVSVCVVTWFWGKDRLFLGEKPQTQYRLTTIEKRDMVNSVSATGTLSAVTTVEVGSEVSGQIKELMADYNSPVKKNQIIAIIDPRSYETLVRQAQAELDMANASLGTQETQVHGYQADLDNVKANWLAAQAQTHKAAVTLDNAKRNLDLQKSLFEREIISKNEYDSALTTYQEASASLDQIKAQENAAKIKIKSSEVALTVAKAKIREAEAQVRLKQAALDKRKVDLENTVIRSPVDGVVIDRSVDIGQTVAASLTAPVLFTIAKDLHDMEVSTSVDEADIGRIKEGQTARFTVDAFGNRKFKGKVFQVRKLGKTVQNVVTYEVIVSAHNQDLSLMPGMTADVEIELLKKPGVLTVSNSALRFTPPTSQTSGASSAQASTGAASQIGGAGMGFGGGPNSRERPDPEARIKEYSKRLNLSESQQQQLREIFKQNRQKIMSAFQNTTPGPGRGIGEMMGRIRKEFQASMIHILDSDQQELYQEMEQEEQSSRGTLWQLGENNQLKMVPVRLGAAGSSYTEVSGPGIKEGMKVIYSMK